jgi:hypothetical protein
VTQAEFGIFLRTEINVDRIGDGLIATIDGALRLAASAIWLRAAQRGPSTDVS